MWKIEYSAQAARQLQKLDNSVRGVVEKFIERLPNYPNPRDIGRALTGQYAGLWRYRVGDYRLVCSIHDEVLIVEVVNIGHRSKVYKG